MSATALSDDLRAVDLTDHHIDDAMALVAEAGWNQVPADWRMMIRTGTAFGYEDTAGRLVASAAALPYGPAFGWISMVLVTASWRRQGIATRLLDQAIRIHEAAGRVPVLDATPAGQQVYERLGFTPLFGFRRWQRTAKDNKPPAASQPLADTALPEVLTLDRAVFGGDRGAIITDIAKRPALAFANPNAFALSRAGRVAQQLGPFVATNPDDAIALLTTLDDATVGPAMIDVPDTQTEFIDAVCQLGFTVERPFQRMARGPADWHNLEKMFALAGPELG